MRTRHALLAVLAACLLVTGCSSTKSSKDLGDPAKVLGVAQDKLASTSGVAFSLKTDDLPDGVQGLKEASGTLTDAPAFDGSLTAAIKLGDIPVPVVAVDGKVYAKIPFTIGWSQVDPADYGAPDPAQLLDAHDGLPAILGATTDPKSGDQARGGQDNKEVFTTYTGTVPGAVVTNLIPSATGDFSASYQVDSSGQLRVAALTGVFYKGSPSMTYTVTLDDYGTSKDISAP